MNIDKKSSFSNLTIDGSDGHGITIHKGGSLELINCRITNCKLRGIQVDAGAKEIIVRGGEIWKNGNDGISGETATWKIWGCYIHDNGGSVDSRDGIQATNPDWFEIYGCRIENHFNAAIIIRSGRKGGIIRNNTCSGRRHCLALESEYSGLVDVRGNRFQDAEQGVFTYGKKPKSWDAQKITSGNVFTNCEHKVLENWGR